MRVELVDCRDVRAESGLSDVDKAQLRFAAERYDGAPHADLAPLFAPDAEWAIDAWRALRDGVPLYDAWVINGDSASFFEAGTPVFAGVEVVHDDIEAAPGTDPELCTALRRAFHRRGGAG